MIYSFLAKKSFFFLLFLLCLGIFLLASKPQYAMNKTLRFLPSRFFRQACTTVGPGKARCHAQVVTDSSNVPLTVPTPPSSGFGPAQFHTAYQLPCTPGGAVSSTCATPVTFGPTIAIVDAYNDPTVENDLQIYSTAYGLPSCTVANGCLQVVNQNGGSSLPAIDSGWALEISLDVQVVHSICQTCKILLVEANTSSIADLGISVTTAANMGAIAISNSYGTSEWSGEKNYDGYYNHPGIVVTASAGDSGYGTGFPAASPYVVAVGGTTLQLYSDNTYFGESVWSRTGSGCSLYESANLWQTSLANWLSTNCGQKRGIADVAADADPNSGASVYDSTQYSGQSGWWIVGGTSLSSPLIASSYVLAGGAGSGKNAGSILYSNFPSGFHDIVSGSNGNCSTAMCIGAVGYDGPTGLGSPNGLLAFITGASASPTPTPTATPTPSVTPVPTATPTPILTPTPTPRDTIPPVVKIISPLNNAFVRHSTQVTINVSASDNVAVAKVEMYLNGVLGAAATQSPYVFLWNVGYARNKKYTLTAKAYDTSGNSSSSTITVTSY